MIDWRSASRYPAVIIFYMNVCFAAACIGWIAQYIPSARQDIICRKDGTARVSEPRYIMPTYFKPHFNVSSNFGFMLL
jgi:smoothened protein